MNINIDGRGFRGDDSTNTLNEIEARVTTLQRSLVELQEDEVQRQRTHQREMGEICLGVIHALDLLEDLQKEDSSIFLRKVAKRLQALLKKHGVDEFGAVRDLLLPGQMRVVESRAIAGEAAGTVLAVCRKGYKTAARVLRPADVITTS